jgi:isopentenyl-diphosphate delta-isomerase
MKQEIFDIYTESGKPAGQATRSKAHTDALWHRSTNVYCFNEDGQLLIQKRQLDKDVCAGYWDLSVAEHLQPGENFENAAQRGLYEELGVSGLALEPVGNVTRSQYIDKNKAIYDYEFQQTFKAVYSGPLQPDPVEIAEVKYISLSELAEEFVNAPQKFTPWLKKTASELGFV